MSLFKAATIAQQSLFAQIPTGFPSPASEYLDARLDLNELCIRNPSATFFIRVSGNFMQNIGIYENDVLIVDRSITARDKDIVVAVIDNEFLIRRYCLQHKFIILLAENIDYPPIVIEKDGDFQVWGVITKVIHHVAKY